MSFGLSQSIARGAQALGVPLAPRAVDTLADLMALTLRHNRRVNLIGRCTVEQAVDRHVHDALALLRVLDRPVVADPARRWLDIGAGGGFPGLVLAAARPALSLTLVEPITKKASLVAHAAATLGLTNATVKTARLEDLPAPAPPAAALSRATFPPAEWLARGRDLVGPGGLVLVLMGGDPDPDVVRAAAVVDRVTLPLSGAQRTNALVLT